jgi:uncharacterized membrane protein YsdA (DUF1294 family)
MGDETIICVECGRPFTWSYGEQRFYSERGLHAPKRCQACRTQGDRVPSMTGSASTEDRSARAARSVRPQAARRTRGRRSAPPRRSRRPSGWADPVYRFGAVAFGLAIVLAAILWWIGRPLDVLLSWLIAITLVTFLAYGYDKAIAGSRMTRVPEKVLLALTLAGGTLGAYVAMALFRHKTVKSSFRLQFWLVALVQLALVVVYYGVIKG